MDFAAIISNPISIAQLILIVVLVVERLITGGWLRLMVGKKTSGNEQEENKIHVLEQHFNHETTAQYEIMIKSQEETLEILRRWDRDGLRIRQ